MNHQFTRVVRFIAIFGLLILMPLIGQSTAPLPAPYQQFSVSGVITRADGGSLENIPVVLTTLTAHAPGGFWIMNDSSGGSRDVALTESGGEFYLRVKTNNYPTDTIAVAVVLPEDDVLLGEPILVDQLTFGTHTNSYTIAAVGYCGTDEVVEYTDGYLYSIIDQTVEIPQD